VPIYIEVRPHPMHFHADMVGEVSEGKQIVGLIKRHALLRIKTLARHDPFSNRQQRRVLNLQVSRKHTHLFDSTGPERVLQSGGINSLG
jgi:hypothetical protein